jgi:hypothetical protein|eukprot:COSAG06_NODE_1960_length_7977_cov_3.230515_2_plen_417_part_00
MGESSELRPERSLPERPGCWSQLWFTYVSPLIADGHRRALTVADAFPLPRALTSEVTTAEFELLWAEECAAAERLVSRLSADERGASERLAEVFKEAQAALSKQDDAVKAADEAVKSAESIAKKQRGAEAKSEAESAVKAAKESHSAAQVASSSAVEAVNVARAAYRAATPQPSMLRTLWRMCWRIWIGSLAFVVMETVAPFLGPIALEVVADKLQQEEIITMSEGILVVALVLLAPLLQVVGQTQGIRINSLVGIKVRAVFCGAVFKKSIRLTPSSVQRIGKGRITNLMSIDSAEIFEAFPVSWSDWWAGVTGGLRSSHSNSPTCHFPRLPRVQCNNMWLHFCPAAHALTHWPAMLPCCICTYPLAWLGGCRSSTGRSLGCLSWSEAARCLYGSLEAQLGLASQRSCLSRQLQAS